MRLEWVLGGTEGEGGLVRKEGLGEGYEGRVGVKEEEMKRFPHRRGRGDDESAYK